MTFMLPSAFGSARSVAGVAEDLLAAVRTGNDALPRARSAVLVIIDGLGALQLRGHAGHARVLTTGMSRKDTAQSVFPTTTAAALTTLFTGVWPGEHGLVGYRVRDPERDVLVNQLSGWEEAAAVPEEWQPCPTIFERAAAEGIPVFAVGTPAYAGSGFSRATLRGATYVAEGRASDRLAHAYDLAAAHEGAIVSCYLPEVDKAGHRYGVDSVEWVTALEDLDAAFAHRPSSGTGVLVTADHGMIDVPAHRHVVLAEGSACFDSVRHVGGEPRMLHVYAEPGADKDGLRDRWRTAVGGAADVLLRDEAFAAGLYGPRVSAAAPARTGDLLVIARGASAVYDGRSADQRAQGMVGQHGALTPEELLVPYLRLGAFSR